MSFEADYVYTPAATKDAIDNINLTYDPATGANFPFNDRANRPYPDWGVVSMNTHIGRSSYHGGCRPPSPSGSATTGRRRPPTRSPASGTPGRSRSAASSRLLRRGAGSRRRVRAVCPRPAPSGSLQRDLAGGPRLPGERPVLLRRRHPPGDELRRRHPRHGRELRHARLRPDGTIVPRNSLMAPAQNRTDVRVQQRVDLPGRASLDLIGEAFNLFNRPNWTIGTQESRLCCTSSARDGSISNRRSSASG